MQRERPKTSLLQVVIIAAVIFSAIVFFVIVINTGDLLWFVPSFNGLPAQIVVHCYGQDVTVNPGDAAFERLNEAVNQSLSGSKRWDSLSLSEATYQEYQDSPTMLVVELSYDPVVRIHSFYKFFKNVDTIIIPLDGRHASSNSIFGRVRELSVAGSFHVESLQLVTTALGEQGICQIMK
jgi:hypothetical protein